MAKIGSSAYEEKPVAPEGKYRATLINVIAKDISGTYNGVTKVTPRFVFVFALIEGKITKNGAAQWKEIHDKGLECIKVTNQTYGNKQASLTEFLPLLLGSRRLADTFYNEIGDTDALLGWQGELSITHTVTGDKVYANVQAVEPSDTWLFEWQKAGMLSTIPPARIASLQGAQGAYDDPTEL